MIVLGCCFLVDGLQGIMHGPLRSMGLQKYGSIVAFVCWWLYALPCAAILSFKADLGLVGLMAGFSSASLLQLILFLIILKRKDWHEVVREAQDRLEQNFDESTVDSDYCKDNF